jgi:cytochrome c-type biogenesis protein CcsB
MTLNEPLSQISLLFVYGAMAFYTLAFLAFATQLSRLASTKESSRSAATGVEKLGIGLLAISAVSHGVAVLLRGIAAGRVPWANMYEFSLTGSFIVVAIFLVAMRLREVRLIATFIAGFTLLVLGLATSIWYVQVKTLPPPLQSYWLVIHVLVAVLATSFFTIAASFAVVYLLRTAGWLANAKGKLFGFVRRVIELFPSSDKLEKRAYRFNIIGFILWSFTLIAGAIWAERAWHRYWGWDTKEVWTFIIWTIYAGYLHANATRGWTGKRSAWLSVIGFVAIIFNFTIVNLFFKGLHVYSGLK